METKKFLIYWLIFLAVISLLLIGLNYLDKKAAQSQTEDLNIKYNVDISVGDRLIKCVNGDYDVYRPTEYQVFLCGQVLTNETRNYLESL